jgi:hypothetical protein
LTLELKRAQEEKETSDTTGLEQDIENVPVPKKLPAKKDSSKTKNIAVAVLHDQQQKKYALKKQGIKA